MVIVGTREAICVPVEVYIDSFTSEKSKRLATSKHGGDLKFSKFRFLVQKLML